MTKLHRTYMMPPAPAKPYHAVRNARDETVATIAKLDVPRGAPAYDARLVGTRGLQVGRFRTLPDAMRAIREAHERLSVRDALKPPRRTAATAAAYEAQRAKAKADAERLLADIVAEGETGS